MNALYWRVASSLASSWRRWPRIFTLQEDEAIVPSSKGHTTASAEAMMKKWGENEIHSGGEGAALEDVCHAVRGFQ